MIILFIFIALGLSALEYYLLHNYYQKKIEEKVALIKNAESQLIQMDKMSSIGVLAAGIAHEINNPLGFLVSNLECLKGYSGSLKKTADNSQNDPLMLEDFQAITEESLEGALRIKRIVSDLRTFSRQSGESSKSQVDINQILESTLSIVWNEIKYKIAIVKDYQAKTQILADSTQLSQVFLNLFINASQATPGKGTLTINTYEDAENIYVQVRDTGSGIPKDVLPRIFEPFFSTKKSSGLGLSVSYNIIRHHGGQIKAESAPGQGTTFTISLPKKI